RSFERLALMQRFDIAKQEKANADSQKAQQDKNAASEQAAQKNIVQAQNALKNGIKPATPGNQIQILRLEMSQLIKLIQKLSFQHHFKTQRFHLKTQIRAIMIIMATTAKMTLAQKLVPTVQPISNNKNLQTMHIHYLLTIN